jgi:hypothetical protein
MASRSHPMKKLTAILPSRSSVTAEASDAMLRMKSIIACRSSGLIACSAAGVVPWQSMRERQVIEETERLLDDALLPRL